jgi:hypothetical protein
LTELLAQTKAAVSPADPLASAAYRAGPERVEPPPFPPRRKPDTEQGVFIEVQHGTSFGEDDIERLEDDYGRSRSRRRALADTARLIRHGEGLQSACLDYGDWDMHSGLGKAGTGWMQNQATPWPARSPPSPPTSARS